MKKLNKFLKLMCVGVLMVSVMCLSATSAFAASDATFSIDFNSSIQTILTVIFGALAAVVSWGIHKVSKIIEKKTAVDIEDSTRAYLETALISGLNYAKAKVQQKAGDLKPLEVENEIVAVAANYVLTKVPDALSFFKIDTDDAVKELILARLPQLDAA